MEQLTKLEKRYLSKFTCAWCDHRMDKDGCSAIQDRCSPNQQYNRRQRALAQYKPRKRKAS